MTVKIKTSPVVWKDGKEGRGVKLSLRNAFKVAQWLREGGADASAKFTEKVLKDKLIERVTIRAMVIGGFRIVRIGDVVVKFKDEGFRVVKAEDFAKYVRI